MKGVGSRLHVVAEVRGQPDQEAAQPVLAQFGQESGGKIWSLVLQNYGSPEGRSHNQGANLDEENAQGGEEGGRRGEKEEVQVKLKDYHSRGNNTASQHLPAVNPQNSVPSGPPTVSPFRTTTISQGKHL